MTKACAAVVPTRSPHQRRFAKKAGTPGLASGARDEIDGQVRKILANYESDNPDTKANLARILMLGKLARILCS